ncbi:MAG: glycosyltransferase family 2 protein [Candidatus Binataceae bacterium]|nr:glycosyltransferase family 2 protein [Candidatus Binataceae bacterium]
MAHDAATASHSDAVQSSAAGSARLEGLSVFLPSHNEEGNLERVVAGLGSILPKITDDYEIIIVDDGSRDRTGEIADRLVAADSHLRVIHHEHNRGYGGAVTSGIAAATKPWVMLCDGDGQFSSEDLGAMAAKADRYDVIVGRRVHRADPLGRRLNGRAWTTLMRLLFGIRIHDLDCGFKLFRRRLVDPQALKARGAMISAELMARMVGSGARIAEVEVRHLPRQAGEQSGADLRVVMRAFRELFLLYGDLRAEARGKKGADQR